ncbi:MAG TPA: hypothetical protein VGX51_02680 [Solirubrobacteraceae bacterium]|jgi:hypothetical protein|nr:hypothetical protein [Solirubrobacteraceae bacterium]
MTRALAVAAVPIKPEYGPTLGRLLSPRWRAARPLTRAAVLAACAGAVALVIGAVLTLENAHYSQGGTLPFGFSYRGLYRTRPDPGGYVKIDRRRANGSLEDSFAVAPLLLPPYGGSLSGELPLYAEGYIRALRQRYRNFVLRGEGKTRVNTVPAYDVLYTAEVQGQTMWGRDVLLLPETPAARRGVDIVMLTTPTSSAQVTSPREVASAGVLLRPLKTFSFG